MYIYIKQNSYRIYIVSASVVFSANEYLEDKRNVKIFLKDSEKVIEIGH